MRGYMTASRGSWWSTSHICLNSEKQVPRMVPTFALSEVHFYGGWSAGATCCRPKHMLMLGRFRSKCISGNLSPYIRCIRLHQAKPKDSHSEVCPSSSSSSSSSYCAVVWVCKASIQSQMDSFWIFQVYVKGKIVQQC